MQLLAFGLSGDDAGEQIGDVGQWVDAVELCGLDQGVAVGLGEGGGTG